MIDFSKALYIKLGEAGIWEPDSIKSGKIRFGWPHIPVEKIINKEWEVVRHLISENYSKRGKKSGSTNDFNILKNICEADEKTVFVTFSNGELYWTIPKQNSISEDGTSKYIETIIPWSDKDINKNKTFELNQISGRITKYQLFMGTCCKIGNDLGEFEYLKQLINDQQSDEFKKLSSSINQLKESLLIPIKHLTPKDFEILVDLIFRNNGWRRTSVLGEVMKFFDLVLEEPFSNKLYGVQIKSSCSANEFKKIADKFVSSYSASYEMLYFVIHTPKNDFASIQEYENVKILGVEELADQVINAGLIRWVMDKIK